MALRYKISKADYDKLSDELKAEYTLSGDNATLDVDGGPDAKAGEKFTAERDRRRAAEKRAKEAEDKLSELEDKAGDVSALERKHAREVEKITGERDAATKKYSDYATTHAKDGLAQSIATTLAGKSAGVILPHIASRITVDMTGDAPKTVIMGKDGKPSTMSADDLTKEFRDNKDFAAIIVGTHASGGGNSRQQAPNGNGNPGHPPRYTPPQGANGEAPLLSSMSPRDLAASIKASQAARGAGGNP